MSAKILDGRSVAKEIQAETEQEVAAFAKEHGIPPTLALVRAGDDPASVSDEQWREMKLNFVGRRTVSRYGCYGCHDIPGRRSAPASIIATTSRARNR